MEMEEGQSCDVTEAKKPLSCCCQVSQFLPALKRSMVADCFLVCFPPDHVLKGQASYLVAGSSLLALVSSTFAVYSSTYGIVFVELGAQVTLEGCCSSSRGCEGTERPGMSQR